MPPPRESIPTIVKETVGFLEQCLRYNQARGDYIDEELAFSVLMRCSHRIHREQLYKEVEILSELVTMLQTTRSNQTMVHPSSQMIFLSRFEVLEAKARERLKEIV